MAEDDHTGTTAPTATAIGVRIVLAGSETRALLTPKVGIGAVIVAVWAGTDLRF